MGAEGEEDAGIQAEMERVKASYMERIKRNQDGIAREKATFLSWVAHEAAGIAKHEGSGGHVREASGEDGDGG